MVGGIFYEHGHRMVATFVGFLTTVQAIWFWRREPRTWVRNLAVAAWVAVVIQGLLGGLTVLLLLPTPVSVSHATLAQLFFSSMVLLALVTSRRWLSYRSEAGNTGAQTLRLAFLSVVAVLVQLVLGAVMRHLHAGMAVPDFPLSYGSLWPALDQDGLDTINAARLDLDLPAVNSMQVLVHLLHRYWAFVVGGIVVTFGLHLMRHYPNDMRLRDTAFIIMGLIGLQILLGALTVWSGRNIEVTTSHVAVGALLLASTVSASSLTYQRTKQADSAATTLAPEIAAA
jgi:cytochrome c oxidase assembly protein subunit 15